MSRFAKSNSFNSFKDARTGGLGIPNGTTAERDPAPKPGEIRWNTTTSQLEFFNGSGYSEVAARGNIDIIKDSFTGDGSTAAYVLTLTPAAEENILVFVGNVYQEPGVNYTVAGATITFTSPPPSAYNIVVLHGFDSTGLAVPAPNPNTIEIDEDGSPVSSAANNINFTGPGVIVTDTGGGAVEVAIEGAGPVLDNWDWWEEAILNSGGAINYWQASNSAITTAVPATTARRSYNNYGQLYRANSGTFNPTARFQTGPQANGGGNMHFGGNRAWKMITQFEFITDFTNKFAAFGWSDRLNVTADHRNGPFFSITNNQVTGVTEEGNNVNQTTAYTLLLNVAYTFDIEINSAATEVRFRIYADDNNTPVFDETVVGAQHIPSVNTSGCSPFVMFGYSGTPGVLTDLGILYRMGVGTLAGHNRARGVGIPFNNITPASYDFVIFADGVLSTSQIFFVMKVVTPFSLPTDMVGSYASALIGSTGTAAITMSKNGTPFGTITYITSTTGTFSVTATSFALGDTLTFAGPVSSDPTLSGINITVKGERL